MNPLTLLAQDKETVDTAVSATQKILDLGVPGLLFLGLVFTLWFGYKGLTRLISKLDGKDEKIEKLQDGFATKVEELMQKNVDGTEKLVAVIEKSNAKIESLEDALRQNEELLTKYRAELAAAKRGET